MTRYASHARTFLPAQSFSVGPCRLCLSYLSKADPCRVLLTMTLHLIHAHLLLTRNHPCPAAFPRCSFLDAPRIILTGPLGGAPPGRGWVAPASSSAPAPAASGAHAPIPLWRVPPSSAAALGSQGGILLRALRQAAAPRITALHCRPRHHRSRGVRARELRRALQRRPDQGLPHLLQPHEHGPAAPPLRIPTHRRVR